jgi:cell division initiation protein
MLTPLDIESKKFKHKVWGYNDLEVEEFLSKVIENYESLYKENIELKDKITLLNEAVQRYKSVEETLQNTLVIAQSTGEDIKKNAHSKGDNIIKEAEVRASQIINTANQEVLKITYKYEELKRNYGAFRARVESLLYSQLEVMKDPDVKDPEEERM